MEQVTQELQNFFHLRFLDNYHQIYEQFKALEYASPAPTGRQNFVEIARHYITIIYLFGLFESFIKVLFPFFVIPLIWGLRHYSFMRIHVLVLVIVISYLLMIYYTLIVRDFIQHRFLFAPAFLLYPWIGRGMELMLTFLKRSPWPRFCAAVFLIVFIVSPAYESAHLSLEQDNVIGKVGEWLANKEELNNARMLTNDLRFPFYSGKERNYLYYANSHHDYVAMEQLAHASHMDLITIRISVKKKDLIPEFEYYEKVEEFIGDESIAIIYLSPEFRKTLSWNEKRGQ